MIDTVLFKRMLRYFNFALQINTFLTPLKYSSNWIIECFYILYSAAIVVVCSINKLGLNLHYGYFLSAKTSKSISYGFLPVLQSLND